VRVAPGASITSHALRGSPAATILKVADEIDADFIVVGNKSMTGVRRVLGSVASAVTSQSPCNVLIVKIT
jgi:nucleotide-binding universal stress UspA family protein